MARWEPDARGRLEEAAMALFQERGYDRTTVSEIAARAGLTERTFFRYFVDKREVLFSGSKDLERIIVEHIEASADASPLELATRALEAAAADLQERRPIDFVRARYALLMKYPEIQERELIKLATLTTSIARALGQRGVGEPAATLTAEAAMAVFKVGFQRWVAEPKRDFAVHIRETVHALEAVTRGEVSKPRRPEARKKKRSA